MAKEKIKMEFRYYTIPAGEYVQPKLGKGWEQEYGLGLGEMLHFHNYLEIGYCYHGKGRIFIEDRAYRYGDDMFTFIPADIPHTTISDAGHICKWEYLFIDIDEFIRTEIHTNKLTINEVIHSINKRGLIKTKADSPIMAGLILNIIEECRNKKLYYTESIKGYLFSLIIEMLRVDEGLKKIHRNVKSHYIERALKYVRDHYSEEIKISKLSEICSLSESYFRRNFEESMNMKPVDYINLVRIQKACNFINKENMSMEDVGYRVGYQTPSTFNRNFKKLTGKTPYQWKENSSKRNIHYSDFDISAKKGWEA